VNGLTYVVTMPGLVWEQVCEFLAGPAHAIAFAAYARPPGPIELTAAP
jgi:hypothetical protein